MPKMFSRWQVLVLWGVLVSLVAPASVLAQRRRTTRRTTTTQTTAPAHAPTQAKPSATPAPVQPQATAPQKTVSPQAAGTPAPKPKETKGTWRLKVSAEQPRLISLSRAAASVSL